MILIALGAAFMVLPVVILLVARHSRHSYDRWVREGTPTRGVVTRLVMHTDPMHSPDDVGSGRSWATVLRFTLPDGREIETESVHRSSPPAGRPGQVVDVRYDPRDPRRAVPVGTPAIASTQTMSTVILVVLTVGLVATGLLLVAIGVLLRMSGLPGA